MAKLSGLCLVWLTLGSLTGCADDPTGMPGVVAQSWEIRLGGTHDAVEPATSVDFSQVNHFQFADPWNLPYPLPQEFFGRFEPPNTPVLWIGENRRPALPPASSTYDELIDNGLSMAAVTYCGFVNPEGKPRDADVDTVERAMSTFLEVVREPFQAAGLVDAQLEAAGKAASEELFARVLAEHERRGVSDPYAESAFFRVLSGRHSTLLTDLIEFIPDLVWTFGDATTRNTLVGCSSALLFDVPYLIQNNHFPHGFDGYCAMGSTGTVTCAREALDGPSSGYRGRLELGLLPPLDLQFASWVVSIDLSFDEVDTR